MTSIFILLYAKKYKKKSEQKIECHNAPSSILMSCENSKRTTTTNEAMNRGKIEAWEKKNIKMIVKSRTKTNARHKHSRSPSHRGKWTKWRKKKSKIKRRIIQKGSLESMKWQKVIVSLRRHLKNDNANVLFPVLWLWQCDRNSLPVSRPATRWWSERMRRKEFTLIN